MINKEISEQGLSIQDRVYKTSAYADDLLFFVTNLHITIPNFLKAFSHYGNFSNLKINLTKSEAINVNLSPSNLARTQANCPFRWDGKALKYLGI